MTVSEIERATMPDVPDRHPPGTKGSRARLGSRVPARWRIAAWILLTTALTLLAVMLTMRSLLLNGAQTQAHQDINQELQEFRAFAAEGVDPTTAKPSAPSRRCWRSSSAGNRPPKVKSLWELLASAPCTPPPPVP